MDAWELTVVSCTVVTCAGDRRPLVVLRRSSQWKRTLTPSQRSDQVDAGHWCSPRRTVQTPTSWHADPPVGQVAKPVIRQLSPTLFRQLVDITKSTVVSRPNSCRFSSFRCKRYLQDAQLSQRDRAAACVIVFAKSRSLELGHLRTL